jgi:hypothetical protein
MSSIEFADRILKIRKKMDEVFDEQLRSLFDSFVKETLEPVSKEFGCKMSPLKDHFSTSKSQSNYTINHPEWEHGHIIVNIAPAKVFLDYKVVIEVYYIFQKRNVEDWDGNVINLHLCREDPKEFFRKIIRFYKGSVYPYLSDKWGKNQQYSTMLDEKTYSLLSSI